MTKRRAEPLRHLVDADPHWVDYGERRGVLLQFECPIHDGCHLGVPVDPALDGGPPPEGRGWKRTGDTFETLTLSPSIRILGGANGCRWHGFIRGGRFETCGDAR